MPFDVREMLILLLFFLPLEQVMPLRPQQKLLRRRWLDDVAYLLLNPWLIRLLVAGLLATLLAPLQSLVPATLRAQVAGLPLWVQVPAALVVAEFGFYAMHRSFHAVPILWKFHAVHHSIEELDWLAAHRVHPVDQALTATASLLPLLMLGFSAPALAIWGFSYFLQSHLIHANVNLRLGWLELVFASPHYHHWHHGSGAAPANFSAQLIFLDQLFGTWHRPDGMPADYGIDDPIPAVFPLALLSPFTKTTEPAQ